MKHYIVGFIGGVIISLMLIVATSVIADVSDIKANSIWNKVFSTNKITIIGV